MREILQLIVDESLPDREIATILGIETRTVKAFTQRMYCRLGISGLGFKRVKLASMFREEQEKSAAPQDLKPRDSIIIQMVKDGCTNAEIANRVGVTVCTLKNYMQVVFDKTGMSSRLELAAWAAAHDFNKEKYNAAST